MMFMLLDDAEVSGRTESELLLEFGRVGGLIIVGYVENPIPIIMHVSNAIRMTILLLRNLCLPSSVIGIFQLPNYLL